MRIWDDDLLPPVGFSSLSMPHAYAFVTCRYVIVTAVRVL